MQLKTLVGLGPEASLALQGDLRPTPVHLELSEGLTQALAARSDLLVARAEVATAEAMIQKEKAEGRWDARSMSAICGRILATIYVGSIRRVAAPNPSRTFFTISVRVCRSRCPCAIRTEHCRSARLDSAVQRRPALVTLTIRQEVTAAFAQYEAAQRALDIYTQGVREVAHQNLEVVRQTYTLGRATL